MQWVPELRKSQYFVKSFKKTFLICAPEEYIIFIIEQNALYSGRRHYIYFLKLFPLWTFRLSRTMAPHSSTLAWKIPWTEEPGRLQVHGVAKSRTWLSDFTFTFHFHALEKEMATHSSILAWRIPGTGEPGGLPSVGSHRVGHNWETELTDWGMYLGNLRGKWRLK